jgi:outer membrane protein OmpA-like peptidoglycan-associated protein
MRYIASQNQNTKKYQSGVIFMTKRISLLSAFALLAAVSLPVISSAGDHKAVVHDARGNSVMDARGNCVRTQWETPSDECGALAAHAKLASVYFDFNKSTLNKKARETLDELLATLKDKKIEAVVIAGYADAVGSDSYNLRLSGKRAHAVQHYLKAHGFHHANTDIRALGKSAASAKCKGEKDGELHACMQEDRRVDIELSVEK